MENNNCIIVAFIATGFIFASLLHIKLDYEKEFIKSIGGDEYGNGIGFL